LLACAPCALPEWVDGVCRQAVPQRPLGKAQGPPVSILMRLEPEARGASLRLTNQRTLSDRPKNRPYAEYQLPPWLTGELTG